MPAVATSIDEVIPQLGDVIERALRERSRVGLLINLGRLVIRARATSGVSRVIAVFDETSTAGV